MSCSLKTSKNWLKKQGYIKEDGVTVIGGEKAIWKAEGVLRSSARKNYGTLPEFLKYNDILGVTKGNKLKIKSPKFFEWIDKSVKIDPNTIHYKEGINYSLKAVDILSSDKAEQVFNKGKKNNWDLNKILTELQIPKEQKQIILEFKTNTVNRIFNNLEKEC